MTNLKSESLKVMLNKEVVIPKHTFHKIVQNLKKLMFIIIASCCGSEKMKVNKAKLNNYILM